MGEAKQRREARLVDPNDPRIAEQTTRLTLQIADLINSGNYNSVAILRAALNTVMAVIAQMPEEVRDQSRAQVRQMFLRALQLEKEGRFITNAPPSAGDIKN